MSLVVVHRRGFALGFCESKCPDSHRAGYRAASHELHILDRPPSLVCVSCANAQAKAWESAGGHVRRVRRDTPATLSAPLEGIAA